MRLFRNNPKNLDAEQTAYLDELKRANLITAKAYQMRLNLQEIYNLNCSGMLQARAQRMVQLGAILRQIQRLSV